MAGPLFELDDTLDLLARTPAVLDALLRGASRAWHDVDEGPQTWSARELVGHLIPGEETDCVPRARIILEQGEGAPLEPHRNRLVTDGASERAWEHGIPGLLERALAEAKGEV